MRDFIYDTLKKQTSYPFHMPGHKRNKKFLPIDAVECDFTEITGLDALHSPSGIIKQAQDSLACFLGADESFILVNGGSGGILAAMLAVLSPGDIAITASNCHSSVQNGFIFTGAVPYYIDPIVCKEGISTHIDSERIKDALSETKAKAVIIVSPTYEGIVSDIEKIAKLAHEKGAVLIVDECHGAHFPYSPYFPESAIRMGADIVVNSYHKTLPCFNQAAVLSIKGKLVNRQRIKQAVSMTMTTSPSYPVMASVDHAKNSLTEEDFKKYTHNLDNLRKRLSKNKVFKLFEKPTDAFDIDRGKITVFVNTEEIDGIALSKILREKYLFELEFCSKEYIIAMTSVADDFDMYIKFAEAVEMLEKEYAYSKKDPQRSVVFSSPHIEATPRDIFFSEKETIPIQKSEGKICALAITAFPPDIPIIFPGERITKEKIERIHSLKKNNTLITGCEHGITVLKGYV